MSRYPLWAVLAPGEPAWLESRAHSIMMTEWNLEDGKEPPFEFVPGSGRYHAIVGMDPMDVGAELQIAEEISLQCDEPVYTIERANDPWTVMSFRHGAVEVEEKDPETLASSLGCPLPGSKKPSPSSARKPMRTAALLEGVRAEEAHRALEEDHGAPLSPGRYHLEETPRGLLLVGGTGGMNFAHINLSERFPRATVYAVTASPSMDIFFATVLRSGESIEEFAQPPYEFPPVAAVREIKGERSPDRILAALGIPAKWFLNE